MRWIYAAVALAFAAPAQAQYTVTITGTGAYDPGQNSGDVTDVLAKYGQSITYSATFVLDRGVTYTGPTAIDYFGHATAVSVNGVSAALVGPDPFTSFVFADADDGPYAQIVTENFTEPRPNDDGFVFGVFRFTPPTFNNGELTDSIADYPKDAFNFVALGGSSGIARYLFTKTGFSVLGTQPTLTPFDPGPGTPGDVPEPAAWAMLIGGFGIAGGAMRRRVRVRYA